MNTDISVFIIYYLNGNNRTADALLINVVKQNGTCRVYRSPLALNNISNEHPLCASKILVLQFINVPDVKVKRWLINDGSSLS